MKDRPGRSRREPDAGIIERLGFALVGGLTGAGYGCLIALLVFLAVGNAQPSLIAWSAAVFAVLGAFFGNLILESLLALLHFLWGLACALADRPLPQREASPGALRSFLLLGFGTGIVLALWHWT